MSDPLATSDAFTTTTAENGFHYVVNAATGEVLPKAYPLRKTANRAARVMSERASETAFIDAAPMPTIEDHEPQAEDEYEADDDLASVADIEAFAEDLAAERSAPKPTLYELAEADRIEREAAKFEEAYRAHERDEPAPILILPARSALSNVPVTETREAWLMAASVMIGSVLAQRAELELPAYRVTCGWPSTKATAKSKRRIGECWNPDNSADAHAEIFISPLCAEAMQVVAILAHELIHAALPKGTAHKAPFVKAAKAIGFLKPFTQITTSPDLEAWTQEIVDALPAYPHAAMNLSAEGAKKPQVNRQLLAKCEEDFEGEACGYQCRLARKWIVTVGPPVCPRCNVPMVCEGLDVVSEETPEGEGDE